jgi:hypothetical protein
MRVLFLLSATEGEGSTVADMELTAVPQVGDAVQLKLQDGGDLLILVNNVLWDLRAAGGPVVFVWGAEDK